MSRRAPSAEVLEEVEVLLAPALAEASPERATGEQRYLKLPHWTFLGVATPPLRAAERAWSQQRKHLDHDELWAVIDALWGTPGPVFEHRRMATLLVERHWRLLEVGDAGRLAGMLGSSETWALVDPVAVALGRTVERRPEAWAPVLDAWASHADFWLRRSALLALLFPLREGRGDFARFGRYADAMLEESEFFVRKAIGWVLRERTRRAPEEVVGWLAPRTARASGLTVREASRHLPAAVRDELVAAQREGRAARVPAAWTSPASG